MKKIDYSPQSLTAGFPVKRGTWKHLQEAYTEAIAGAARGVIPLYAANTFYILDGMEETVVGINTNYSSGNVFYNGEVYSFPGFSYSSLPVGQVLVATKSTSTYNAVDGDPVLFTDGSNHSVHIIETIAIGFAASGSGLADYSSFKRILKQTRNLSWVPANPTVIEFTSNRTFVSDPQSTYAAINFTFRKANAVEGCKVRFYLGIDQTSTSINFQNNANTKTILTRGATGVTYNASTISISASDPSGTKRMFIELEYVGTDIYNNFLVTASVFFS